MIITNFLVGLPVMLLCLALQAFVTFWCVRYYIRHSCSRFGRVELLISSHPAQAGLFSTRPGENPA